MRRYFLAICHCCPVSKLGDLDALLGWWGDAIDATPETLIEAEVGYNLSIVSGGSAESDIAAAATTAYLANTDAATVTDLSPDPDGWIDFDAWMDTCAKIRAHRYGLLTASRDDGEWADKIDPVLEAVVDQLRDSPFGGVLVDGPTCAAATFVLHHLDPDVTTRIRPLQRSDHPVETLIWERMDVSAILPVTTGLTDGELGPVAIELINTTIRLAQTPLEIPE